MFLSGEYDCDGRNRAMDRSQLLAVFDDINSGTQQDFAKKKLPIYIL